MKNSFCCLAGFIICLFFSSCSLHKALSKYDARVSEGEILTPLPTKIPRINGPKVYGARPNKDFLFRIPCQGERPIAFTIRNLPSGLFVSEEGIIYGITPSKKGEYVMEISAKNKYGTCGRKFKLIVGEKIALTPPTGWNTWGGYMLCISDSLIRSVADFFIEKGLADVGYQYLGIDDCWMKMSPEMFEEIPLHVKSQHQGFDYEKIMGNTRDVDGNIIPNSSFSRLKETIDYVHSKGLKVGIYSSPGQTTCQRMSGSLGYEEKDANQYARWGIDLLKYDLCSGAKLIKKQKQLNPKYSQIELWRPMATFLKRQNRDIVFNLCQYGQDKPWEWAPSIGIQSWRCTGDLNRRIDTYFDSALNIVKNLGRYAGPGHWNDPDFMYIHYIKDQKQMMAPCVEIPLSTNQRYQYVTLWSMICAPFFFSCNIELMNDFTLRLLSNPYIMNINQDELGVTADIVRETEQEVILKKTLHDHSVAIAIFNRSSKKKKKVDLTWNEIGVKSSMNVFDVWRMKNIGDIANGIQTLLSPNGVVLYILSPV